MQNLAKRIIPLVDRILVRKVKPSEKTASGILLPLQAQESLNHAEVIAVGPGSEDYKVTLRPGDRVILPSFGGTAIKTGEKQDEDQLYLYRESELLAKFTE